MNNINDEYDFLKRLVKMLEVQLGEESEIVLHDLTRPYDSTIVEISNGHISGRKVGDSGTNLGLEVLRGRVKNGDRFNYVTNTKEGRILKSSSIYIYDNDHKVIGSLCINTDITKNIELEKYFHDKNSAFNEVDNKMDGESSEIFANNVGEIIDFLIIQAQNSIGKPVIHMTREDKIEFIKYLDERGAFLITKSGEKIGNYLNISKYTLYQYLDMAKNNKKEK